MTPNLLQVFICPVHGEVLEDKVSQVEAIDTVHDDVSVYFVHTHCWREVTPKVVDHTPCYQEISAELLERRFFDFNVRGWE